MSFATSPAMAGTDDVTRISDAVSKAAAGHGNQAPTQAGSGSEAAVSGSGASRIAMPRNGKDGVTVTKAGVDFKLGLPTAAAGVRVSNGTVVYGDARGSSNVAVQTLADGSVRALVVLSDKSAPNEYRFPLTLPAGSSLAQSGDGTIDVVNDKGWATSEIQAPWAKDAKGTPVPTSYRIEGNTVVQTVQHDSATAYPVVADPTWGWEWWPAQGPVAFMNKGETATIANSPNWAVVGIITGYLAPNPQMAAYAALSAFSMQIWAQRAVHDNKCIKYVLDIIVIEGQEYTGGNCH